MGRKSNEQKAREFNELLGEGFEDFNKAYGDAPPARNPDGTPNRDHYIFMHSCAYKAQMARVAAGKQPVANLAGVVMFLREQAALEGLDLDEVIRSQSEEDMVQAGISRLAEDPMALFELTEAQLVQIEKECEVAIGYAREQLEREMSSAHAQAGGFEDRSGLKAMIEPEDDA